MFPTPVSTPSTESRMVLLITSPSLAVERSTSISLSLPPMKCLDGMTMLGKMLVVSLASPLEAHSKDSKTNTKVSNSLVPRESTTSTSTKANSPIATGSLLRQLLVVQYPKESRIFSLLSPWTPKVSTLSISSLEERTLPSLLMITFPSVAMAILLEWRTPKLMVTCGPPYLKRFGLRSTTTTKLLTGDGNQSHSEYSQVLLLASITSLS